MDNYLWNVMNKVKDLIVMNKNKKINLIINLEMILLLQLIRKMENMLKH